MDNINQKKIKNILEAIEQAGPKTCDVLYDKYVFSENDAKNQHLTNNDISMISRCINNRQYALNIYESCRNAAIKKIFMDYFGIKLLMLIQLNYKPSNEQIEYMQKIETAEPNLKKYQFDGEISRRLEFVKTFGWSVPTLQVLDRIYKFYCQDNESQRNRNAVVEIGAGLGLWSALMAYMGLNVISTDIGRTKEYYQDFSFIWYEVKFMDAIETIKQYGEKCNMLFVSWPTPNDKVIGSAVKKFTGSKIIYIGEKNGGSMGDDIFFTILKNEFNLIDTINIPNWPGTHDKAYFYQRK